MNRYAYRSPLLRGSARVIDAVGRLAFRPSSAKPRDVRRIVLFRLDQIGDAFYATPFLDYLAAAYPGARIDVVTTTRCAPVFAHHPALGRVIVYDYPRFARGGKRDGLGRLLSLARELRGRYDLAVDPRGEPLVAMLSWLAAPVRVGLAGEEVLSFLYTHPVRYDPAAPAWHRFRAILAALGIEAATWVPRIALTPEEESVAAADAARIGAFVGFHLGAGVPFKRWPVERFAALARIVAAKGLAVVTFGTADEKALADELREAGAVIEDRSGQLSVRATYALLAHARAFVGNDSAVVHLAAPHGMPAAHLMSAASPASAAALGAGVRVIVGDDPAHACAVDACPYPCPHLAAIGAEKVARAIGVY